MTLDNIIYLQTSVSSLSLVPSAKQFGNFCVDVDHFGLFSALSLVLANSRDCATTGSYWTYARASDVSMEFLNGSDKAIRPSSELASADS